MSLDLQAVGAKYRELLDQKDELDRKYKTSKKIITDQMETLENYAKAWMQENGLDKLQTDRMTFSLSEQTLVNVENWDEFYEFILEREDFGYLQKRVKSTEITSYIDETGVAPPGIKTDTMIKVNHRRK